MIEQSFVINGKKVKPGEFREGLEGPILKQVEETTQMILADVHCPKHHSVPKILWKGDKLSDLSYTVEGCCDLLTDELHALIIDSVVEDKHQHVCIKLLGEALKLSDRFFATNAIAGPCTVSSLLRHGVWTFRHTILNLVSFGTFG